MIDTEVRGSVAQVEAAAAWLRESLRAGVDDAATQTAQARRTAQSEWHGLSGNAYASFAGKLVDLSDDHVKRVGRAADSFDAFAGHLQGVQDRMGGFRGEARGGGLTVSGFVIQAPPAVPALPGLAVDATPDEARAWQSDKQAHDAGLARIELYDRLLGDVQAEFTRHADWIDANLGPAATAAEDDGGVSDLVAQLQKSWGQFLAGAGVQFWEGTLAKKAGRALDLAAENQRKADDLRRARRSGNPARAAEGNAPGARERVRDYARNADDLAEQAKWLRLGGKFLGPLGLVADGYFGYQEIQDGGSPTGVVLSSVAGTVAAVGVVAIAGTVGAPVLATAAAAGLVAVGVGWAVGEGWDALPDEFTNSVDDAVGDAADAVGDTLSDGWDEVSSWF